MPGRIPLGNGDVGIMKLAAITSQAARVPIGIGVTSGLITAGAVGALQRSELAKGEGTFVLPTMMLGGGLVMIIGGIGAIGEKQPRLGASMLGLGIGAIAGTVAGYALGSPLHDQWKRDNGVT